jgi:FtsP/CotA-like multicopper oxidase with cupredoxin domain
MLGIAMYVGLASQQAIAQTHTYYIAADEVTWNYAPSGMNKITGERLPTLPPTFIGYTYKKAIYREYSDATFTRLKPRPPEWQHLGILGPLLRAEVGDTIRVVFRNNTKFPASMHPHGLEYDKCCEGAPYDDGVPASEKGGADVKPGHTFTYVWEVPERSGPGPNDPSSILWFYHSHVTEVPELAEGLLGPIIITRKGTTKPNGTPKGVDREFIVSFDEFDENQSNYRDDNIKTYLRDKTKVTPPDNEFTDWYLSNLIDTINGRMYGNLPMMTMHKGEHVRWYLLAGASSNFDFHIAHWHGQNVLMNGNRMDMVELSPASMRTVDMYPDNPGIWLLHCHFPAHLEFGMLTLYKVSP